MNYYDSVVGKIREFRDARDWKQFHHPKDMAAGPGRNVGQAYARFAQARDANKAGSPNFDDAVVRHTMIDAMERSHIEGKVIKLD